MNKEEIEEAKKHYIFTTEHELDNNNKRLEEYVEYLESILDKVTNKLKSDIENVNNNIKHMEEKTILQTIARELAIGMRDYAKELLNVIEGEKV